MEENMEHSEFKEMIQFYLYEELDLDKKRLFEKHAHSCNDCRVELESYKKLFEEILKDSQSPLNPKLLMEARLELRGLLRSHRSKVSLSNKIMEIISRFITKPYGLAVSGISVLLIGLFIGYLVFNTPAIENIKTANSFNDPVKIRNVNFIDSDPSDGQVEFTFDAIKSGHFKGNINDLELQQILTYAVLNEQNPGTRLNSINVINAAQTNKINDDEIKNTLMAVAKYDENPGVRREALNSLTEIPIDNDIKNTLIYVLLNDTSAGIRIEAINSLVQAAKKGLDFNQNDLTIFRDKIKSDNNNYVRFQANNIIKEY